jgi:gamma-glutamyltranspeptidase/glutathione hydrolase
VASPHHLASSAGLAVLADGGNALDAAIATNLTLGVVTPYLCGFGGDLFAMVWQGGEVHGYNGSGRAGAAETVDAKREAAGADELPPIGPHTVTVPGAVRGWFDLLDRFGTRSFGALADRARGYARDGFVLSEMGARSIDRAREAFVDSKDWLSVYGEARANEVLRQRGLARTLETLAAGGPDAFYGGPIAHAIAGHLQALGALMTVADLADHRGDWVTPISGALGDVEVLEMPPNSQGVVALEALRIAEAIGPLPPDGADRHHLLIEAVKLALADRAAYVTDPEAMAVTPETLASEAWARQRAAAFHPDRATDPGSGRPALAGTAYLCAADADGMLVSLIQSNYAGFGSGVTVPGWGINLQNRGTFFSLDPADTNVIAPRKRTMHTLMPAMALRDGKPWLVFGTMGGDGQAQFHVQLLSRIVGDGDDLQRAIDAPRWVVSPRHWTVTAERGLGQPTLDGLRRRGHEVAVVGDHESLLGHAHAIEVTANGYAGATDLRAEGAVLGF